MELTAQIEGEKTLSHLRNRLPETGFRLPFRVQMQALVDGIER
jgi:hypothetical protein